MKKLHFPIIIGVFFFLVSWVGSAQAIPTIYVNANLVTDTEFDYSLSGFFIAGTAPISYTYGPWTLNIASPVPENENETFYNYDWSLRTILEYDGLSGSRIDYLGLQFGAPNTAYADVFNLSGELADVTIGQSLTLILNEPKLATLDITSDWTVNGYHRISLVPEPSTFLLLGGGLIGLAFAVRRRRRE